MRIWHDNKGKGRWGGWYLNWVLVRDIQTQEKYHFVVNQWLAVEEDDGEVVGWMRGLMEIKWMDG